MNLAIFGATGAVGRELINVLPDIDVRIDDITLLASERSAGKQIETHLGTKTVQAISETSFDGIDYAIFSAGGSRSKEWAPIAVEAGCTVIDNSSAFRYDNDRPLVIPEINGQDALGASIIANPNCTVAIAAMALYPLYKEFGLKKMIVSTYQSTSGAGAAGMQELINESSQFQDILRRAQDDNPDADPQSLISSLNHDVFAHPIPFNIIPQIDAFQDNGFTKEEMKMVWETQKIFNDPTLKISCTAVRIPVLRAHSEAITIETEKPITPETARTVLVSATGVDVVDNPEQLQYPMPLTASGKYNIEVGRIRQSLVFGDHGLDFFIAGDQLLRGAAWNAVKILEHIILYSS